MKMLKSDLISGWNGDEEKKERKGGVVVSERAAAVSPSRRFARCCEPGKALMDGWLGIELELTPPESSCR
jgi:hypothetical protein